MQKIIDIRSRLATRALLWILRRGAGAFRLYVLAFLMPKTLAASNIRVSRRGLEAIVRYVAPEDVSAWLARINTLIPNSIWVAAFAVEYGLLRGDWEFAERFLQPCIGELFAMGVQPPKRYLNLLVASQIEAGRPAEAMQSLLRYACYEKGTSAEDAHLLAASALAANDADWLARVREVFKAHGMGTLSLAGAESATKFARLSARSLLPDGAMAAKVTVIVSCFNSEEHLETSLCSLFKQSHSNLEIIAVDDNSSDSTWKLLTALAKREPRLRLLRNAKNVGTFVSRNRALRVSTGEYVTTQDSDDWSHPDRINYQLAVLEARPDAVASYCAGLRMWSDGRFEVHEESGNVIRPLCYASLMYRKKAILDLTGYWDCVRVEADAEYLRRVLRLCGPASVVACAKPLMIQLRRENSLTTTPQTSNIRRLRDGPRLAYRAEAARFAKRINRINAAKARYDFEAWHRPFPAPHSIVVPDDLVREAASWSESDHCD